MKMRLSAVLFALSIAACGGDEPMHQAPPITSFIPAGTPMTTDVTPQQPTVSEPVTVETPVATVVEKPAPTKYDEALALGRELVAKGDRAGAKEMFEAAIKLDKKKAEPHIELSRMYISLGEKGIAVVEANKAVKLAPNSSVAWNTKGRAELNRFAYEDAITAFTKSVELNRDNVWAWNNLGFAELQLKRYDDAAIHLSEATTRKGATGYMWNNLGIALEQLDRLDEARFAFEQGGKLGSVESSASRKRLEGVKSIAMAKDDTRGDVNPKANGYDLGENQTDEDVKMQGSGSAESQDNATK